MLGGVGFIHAPLNPMGKEYGGEASERQVANKKAAATFTSAAFTNLMSGFGGSSSLLNRQNTSNLYNTIEGFMKNTGETGTDNN